MKVAEIIPLSTYEWYLPAEGHLEGPPYGYSRMKERGEAIITVNYFPDIPFLKSSGTAQRLQDPDCRSLVKRLVIIATFRGEDTGGAPRLAGTLFHEVKGIGGNIPEQVICFL